MKLVWDKQQTLQLFIYTAAPSKLPLNSCPRSPEHTGRAVRRWRQLWLQLHEWWVRNNTLCEPMTHILLANRLDQPPSWLSEWPKLDWAYYLMSADSLGSQTKPCEGIFLQVSSGPQVFPSHRGSSCGPYKQVWGAPVSASPSRPRRQVELLYGLRLTRSLFEHLHVNQSLFSVTAILLQNMTLLTD